MHELGMGVPRRIAALLASTGVLLLGGVAVPTPAVATDSIRAQQWYLDAMKAPDMWKTTTGKGITVAVIDSGVEADHPDLVSQLVTGRDFSGLPGGVTSDPEGHGTGVASVIAGTGKGREGHGAVGLAPGVKILPLRTGAKSANAAEDVGAYVKQLSEAIRYAADSDAEIINISLGSRGTGEAMQQAVDYALRKGKLVVAAVGNSGDKGNHLEYPAALPGVVGVAAVDRDIRVTDFSEHGPQVALAAPGVDMYHACTMGTGYCKTSGTSDAAPIVSASAALVWSVHPQWTANQVLRVLLNTAGKDGGPGRGDFLGYGVVRPRIALTNPGDPGAPDVNPLLPAGRSASPSASAAASPSRSAAAVGGASADTSRGSGDAAAPAESDGGSALGLWIGAGVGVLVLAAVVAGVLVRRGRDRNPPAQSGPQPGAFGPPPGGPYGGGNPPS